MTDRFNLLELRQAAEDRDDDEPLGHVCMTGVYALALVEAVEALKWQQDQIGWDPDTPPARALARFDFEEEA